jgi:phage terminase large subunit-like protein
MRMHACCGILEAGHIYLPERAEWLSAYLNEIKAFPYGRHDDQVDSTSQAIHRANQDYFRYGSGNFAGAAMRVCVALVPSARI